MLPFAFATLILAMLALPASMLSPSNASEVWPTPKDAATHVRVYKAERKMELWAKDMKLRTFKISLGPNPIGDKISEGDGRTPEGKYFLDFRKADSVAYKSIHISYPSQEDRTAAQSKGLKPGGAIMIHGNWNGYAFAGPIMSYFDWTNGCIGLTNADMDVVWAQLAWMTPIEIYP